MKFIGIDGCRGGWFMISLNDQGDSQINLLRHINELDTYLVPAERVFIDIPIGLLGRHSQERECDKQARAVLGAKRGASIFPAPSRCALNCKTYQEANARNRHCTGRGLSRQCFGILPKIREVDEYLGNENKRSKIYEMHPEICFWSMNQSTPLAHNKKKMEGYAERLRLLSKVYPHAKSVIDSAMQTYPRAEVARDDVVDALVGAVTAKNSIKLRCFPDHSIRDEMGLVMQIVY